MTTNGKFSKLLKAEKKTIFTRRNIIFYTVLGVSVILLIIFVSSLSFASIYERPLSNFTHIDVSSTKLESRLESYGDPPDPEFFIDASGVLIVSLPMWSIGALISSAVGFGSTILTSSLSKTMLLEDKSWLRIWSKKGKLTSHYMFKRVQIQLENNRISILKLGKKYRFKIPVKEGLNLSRFGFKAKNDFFVGYFVKEELASTIHVLTTQL